MSKMNLDEMCNLRNVMQWVNGLEEKLGLPYSMIDIDPSGKYLDDSLIALGEALSKIYKELDAYI